MITALGLGRLHDTLHSIIVIREGRNKTGKEQIMKPYTFKHTITVVGLVAFLLSVMWTIMPQTIHALS
ncbi:MAG: hypothetical protein DYG89_51395 [Caldilinea sp. CFX5]|nr:hypothetical protein [Caldilinea sp. CFX5]